MKFSEIFIRRPVATVLVTLAIMLAGIVAFNWLPVSPLPQVDFPTIRVRAKLPGASPETMARHRRHTAGTHAGPYRRHQ